MNKKLMEQMLSSEMKEIKGGATGTCICENGGAGETVIVIKEPTEPKPTEPKPPIYTI